MIIACICFLVGGFLLGLYTYHRALRSAGFLGKLAAKQAEKRLQEMVDIKPEPPLIDRDFQRRRREERRKDSENT
jgi:hypothetical protein